MTQNAENPDAKANPDVEMAEDIAENMTKDMTKDMAQDMAQDIKGEFDYDKAGDGSPEIQVISPQDAEDGDEVNLDNISSFVSQSDELKDQMLRMAADNANLRRRTDREVSAAKKYGSLGLARDLLSSVDNIEKAISLIPEDKNDMDEAMKNILIGVEISGRELGTVLERHGIKKISPEGEKFDYNFHQAMFEVPTQDGESGIVMQVIQPGYVLHDRLLRPAMVGVSKSVDADKKE